MLLHVIYMSINRSVFRLLGQFLPLQIHVRWNSQTRLEFTPFFFLAVFNPPVPSKYIRISTAAAVSSRFQSQCAEHSQFLALRLVSILGHNTANVLGLTGAGDRRPRPHAMRGGTKELQVTVLPRGILF